MIEKAEEQCQRWLRGLGWQGGWKRTERQEEHGPGRREDDVCPKKKRALEGRVFLGTEGEITRGKARTENSSYPMLWTALGDIRNSACL